MTPFLFITDPGKVCADQGKLYVVRSTATDEAGFAADVARAVEAPTEPGKIDALDPLLRDLSWIAQKRIVLFHPMLPIEGALRAAYARLLRGVARYWTNEPAHDVVFAFDPALRAELEALRV